MIRHGPSEQVLSRTAQRPPGGVVVSIPQFQARITGFPDSGITVHSISGRLSIMQE